MNPERSHYCLIDGLKVLAAQIIVLHHCVSYGQLALAASLQLPNVSSIVFDYGRYAVQVFLVVAGYLAAQSAEKAVAISHAHSTLSGSRLVLQLAIRRYLRLVGPYVVALLITIVCAALARQWSADEYIGQPETIAQVLAHLFLLQGVLGHDSISAGVWYVAIDWQLFTALAVIYAVFQRPVMRIAVMAILIVASLLYFNRHASFEDSFIYFIGAYGLGILAYWAGSLNAIKAGVNQGSAKKILLAIACILLLSGLHSVWLRNYLALGIAFLLLYAGNRNYSHPQSWLASAMQWASPRAYCAFLIHFAFILLANTTLIALGVQSPAVAVAAIGLVSVLSWIAANYLYRWVELPIGRWRPAALFS
jgi:peptidoglycan/LPS O-acetylase OafA/YrhL